VLERRRDDRCETDRERLLWVENRKRTDGLVDKVSALFILDQTARIVSRKSGSWSFAAVSPSNGQRSHKLIVILLLCRTRRSERCGDSEMIGLQAAAPSPSSSLVAADHCERVQPVIRCIGLGSRRTSRLKEAKDRARG
jgi:hypothetical protein